MKKSNLIGAFALLITAAMGVTSSQAALVDQGNITLDDATNLEWLDVSATNGFSYNSAEASTYVTVDGFRHAIQAEIVTLYTNGGIPNIGSITNANFAPAQSLLLLMGITAPQGNINA